MPKRVDKLKIILKNIINILSLLFHFLFKKCQSTSHLSTAAAMEIATT
jgi:hypothetical protein